MRRSFPSQLLILGGAALLLPLSSPAQTPADAVVHYGGLSDKGILGADIRPHRPDLQRGRSRPEVTYLAQTPTPDKPGRAVDEKVEIDLRETAGVAREGADVSFGFPLAEGALFDLRRIRVTEADGGREIPVQAHALALWPDGSVKSALLQFRTDVAASAAKKVVVQFGNDVPRAAAGKSALRIREDKEAFRVSTGRIEVVVGRDGFIPLREVYLSTPKKRLLAKGSGLEWRDENGELFSSALGAPESIRVERQGSREAVIRAEGRFQAKDARPLMRYVARLRFVEGSARVGLTLTFINDALVNEFTDTRSLGFSLDFPSAEGWRASLPVGEAVVEGENLTVLQADERSALTQAGGESKRADARAPGWLEVQAGGDRVQLSVRDFWQRWPKGLETSPGRLTVRLLPPQPEGYGRDLPDHLRYPFVEERYRLKWGMSFTERLTFDFRPSSDAGILAAEVNTPIVAVLPPSYIAATGVYGALPLADGSPEARALDAYMDRSMELHHRQREEQREYGYLNWGDWFGERGRNWGNNEYDRAHGFFTHYLQTGQPVYLAEAIAGARHQADVDIVHAYPDPFYVGANVQHSIGHTGISYQKVTPKTWTHQYDLATYAGNGHTWADGMSDIWLATGDPVVMESLLGLGEHIRWAFLPSFRAMGSHERSAGWSLQAALAVYRATSDPELRKVADHVVSLALAEWDQPTGIWPHELPAGHTRGKKGIIGNSVYNLGILLTGMAKYHEATGDERLLPVMSGTGRWLVKTFDPAGAAWPYAAASDGTNFLTSLTPNLNALIFPGLAYTGLVTRDPEFLRVAHAAFANKFRDGADDPLAKEYSLSIYATPFTLALLQKARAQNLLPPPADVLTHTQANPNNPQNNQTP